MLFDKPWASPNLVSRIVEDFGIFGGVTDSLQDSSLARICSTDDEDAERAKHAFDTFQLGRFFGSDGRRRWLWLTRHGTDSVWQKDAMC